MTRSRTADHEDHDFNLQRIAAARCSKPQRTAQLQHRRVVQVHHLASVLLLDLLAQPRPELHRPPTVLPVQERPSVEHFADLHGQSGLHGSDVQLSLPFLVASYVMRDRWVFGDFMCRLVRFLFYFNLYCSIFFLTCISVHRYMGICHPIRNIALESKRVVRGICATVWVIVFILTCPIVKFAKTGDVLRKIGGGVNKANDSWSKVVEMLEKSRWRYIGTVGMTQLIVSFPNTCLMESFYTFWASSSLLSSSHGVTRMWCGPSSKRFTASHRCKRKEECAAGSKGSKTGRPCPSLALNMRRTSTGGASPLKS